MLDDFVSITSNCTYSILGQENSKAELAMCSSLFSPLITFVFQADCLSQLSTGTALGDVVDLCISLIWYCQMTVNKHTTHQCELNDVHTVTEELYSECTDSQSCEFCTLSAVPNVQPPKLRQENTMLGED